MLVALPLPVGPHRDAAAEVHGDGGIPAGGPDSDPAVERGSATSVDQDHRWNFLVRLSRIDGGEPGVGEDSRGTALVGEPLVEEGFDFRRLNFRELQAGSRKSRGGF